MSKLRLVLPALVILVFALGLTACGSDDEDDGGGSTTADITGGEETLDLTIGDIVPLTGDLADFGPPGEKAADLAVEQINSAVEEAGVDHTVKIVNEDDCGGADPQCRGSGRSQAGGHRRRELHRRGVGIVRHDPDRANRSRSGRGAADLAGFDQR